jgi:hypothetical protein
MIIMATNRTDYGLLLAPIAIAMVGGLGYATFVTLYVVPIAYDIINRKYKIPEEFKALKDANIDKIDEDNIFDETDHFFTNQIRGVIEGKQIRIIPPIREWNKKKTTRKYIGEENTLKSLETPLIYGTVEEYGRELDERVEDSPFPLNENWAEENTGGNIVEDPQNNED